MVLFMVKNVHICFLLLSVLEPFDWHLWCLHRPRWGFVNGSVQFPDIPGLLVLTHSRTELLLWFTNTNSTFYYQPSAASHRLNILLLWLSKCSTEIRRSSPCSSHGHWKEAKHSCPTFSVTVLLLVVSWTWPPDLFFSYHYEVSDIRATGRGDTMARPVVICHLRFS